MKKHNTALAAFMERHSLMLEIWITDTYPDGKSKFCATLQCLVERQPKTGMIRNIYGEGKTVGAAVRSLKQRLNKTDNLALYDPDRAAMLNKNLNTHFL